MELNGFNAAAIEPAATYEPLPSGNYSAVIVESEEKPTKAMTGSPAMRLRGTQVPKPTALLQRPLRRLQRRRQRHRGSGNLFCDGAAFAAPFYK